MSPFQIFIFSLLGAGTLDLGLWMQISTMRSTTVFGNKDIPFLPKAARSALRRHSPTWIAIAIAMVLCTWSSSRSLYPLVAVSTMALWVFHFWRAAKTYWKICGEVVDDDANK